MGRAAREATSGPDGTATVPALSLTGTYTITVSKDGFAEENVKDIILRAGETATIKVRLLLGRKISYLPLLNSAFRPAKGTGDLFVNAVYFVTGVGGRRQPAVTIDGATNDDPWGRQTMLATVPVGAVQEMAVPRSPCGHSTWFSPEDPRFVRRGSVRELRC